MPKLGPGSFFGHKELISNTPREFSAECLSEKGYLIIIDKEVNNFKLLIII